MSNNMSRTRRLKFLVFMLCNLLNHNEASKHIDKSVLVSIRSDALKPVLEVSDLSEYLERLHISNDNLWNQCLTVNTTLYASRAQHLTYFPCSKGVSVHTSYRYIYTGITFVQFHFNLTFVKFHLKRTLETCGIHSVSVICY